MTKSRWYDFLPAILSNFLWTTQKRELGTPYLGIQADLKLQNERS